MYECTNVHESYTYTRKMNFGVYKVCENKNRKGKGRKERKEKEGGGVEDVPIQKSTLKKNNRNKKLKTKEKP